MARIQVLPEVLTHKIAAGEIVERPASVVKELLENALDAQASRISVEAQDGGRKSIVVRDDGIGMSKEDARLAFHRHATSKITRFEDLDAITTLGFRGEALPSIASVSRLRLKTIDRETAAASPLGTELEYEGGELKRQRELTWPAGTEITVADLFFNVPARRKFLRAAATELAHLNRQVAHYALAYPEVEFRFRHGGRAVFEAPSVSSLRDRAFQVLGESALENLVPLQFEHNGVCIRGFTSLPHEQRSNTNAQYVYVNRRMVRDRVLHHAIRLAYKDLIPAAAHPSLILLVELSPSLVDVNVHPAKTEIRFHRSDDVHRAVYHGIQEALLQHQSGLSSLARGIPAEQLQSPEGMADEYRERILSSVQAFSRQSSSPFSLFGRGGPAQRSGDGGLAPTSSWPASSRSSSDDPHAGDIPETAHLSGVPVVLGQFVESFIVAADRDGVMLIDQHVAHERILYDRALTTLDKGGHCPSQRLLTPLTIDLSPPQKLVVDQILEELVANGFEVEPFGNRTIVVKAVPDVAKDRDAGALISEIIDDLSSGVRDADRSGEGLRRRRERLAISLSCRAAIKINTPLAKEKMQWMLDALFQCRNPYTCPHGRPIVLRMSIEDVLRGFHRI